MGGQTASHTAPTSKAGSSSGMPCGSFLGQTHKTSVHRVLEYCATETQNKKLRRAMTTYSITLLPCMQTRNSCEEKSRIYTRA
jgi:hypothetical protein